MAFGQTVSSIPKLSEEMLLAVRTRFVRNVYQWMAGGLALTAATAFMVVMSPSLMMNLALNPTMFMVLIFAELGLVIALSGFINRMSVRMASWVFLAYSALNGVTISVIFVRYTPSSVGLAFVVAAATFGCAALYGTFTRRDLTSVGSFAFMGLIGIIIASVASWFMASPALDYLISYAGVLIFTALAAYDSQKIQMIGMQAAAMDEGTLSRSAIMGALALYLDFINLFLMLVRVLGRARE